MKPDAALRSVLSDARVRRFQLTVAEFKNGDPHLFVAPLAGQPGDADDAGLLQCALEDGTIDDAIVWQNLELDWLMFETGWRDANPDVTFASEPLDLRLTEVSSSDFARFLRWASKGPKPYEPASVLPDAAVEAIVGDFALALLGRSIAALDVGDVGPWRFSRVIPNFLNVYDDEKPDGPPAFFDVHGENYAWMGVDPGRWFLLLLSVYPCSRPFDSVDRA